MVLQHRHNLIQVLESRRLVSVMNRTKWQKLVSAMTVLKDFDPLVRVKYLHDSEDPTDFAPIWWDQLADTGFEWIE